ncbi:MAG: hypothetical protein FWB90_03495 [Fibromonadales bacterium]|nr:hypothetical protein [Fibromonadales bacterium]
MNYSKIFASSLFIAGLAFSQNLLDYLNLETEAVLDASSPANPEPETPPPPPPPPSYPPKKLEKTAPVEGKTIFDKLRGHAYNPYSTVGAATNVEDLVLYPNEISEQQFFYVSPTDRLGYTAFGLGSGSALFGLDNSVLGSPAAFILGYATPNFGLALNLSLSKNFRLDEKYNERTTNRGDNIGLYYSSSWFYANLNWLTYGISSSIDNDGYVTKTDYSRIEANIGILGKSSALAYDGYINVIRVGGSSVDNDGNKSVDANSFLGLAAAFNLGYGVLQNSTARVIVGFNNRLVAIFYDEIDKENGDIIGGFVVSPNILAEVSLFENWLAFGGAAHSLLFSTKMPNSGPKIIDIMHSDGTEAFAGIRYQKTNWALEALISTDMFNNPFGGFNGSNVFAEVGGFIYF